MIFFPLSLSLSSTSASIELSMFFAIRWENGICVWHVSFGFMANKAFHYHYTEPIYIYRKSEDSYWYNLMGMGNVRCHTTVILTWSIPFRRVHYLSIAVVHCIVDILRHILYGSSSVLKYVRKFSIWKSFRWHLLNLRLSCIQGHTFCQIK